MKKKSYLYLSGMLLVALSLLLVINTSKEASAQEQKPKKVFKWKMQSTSPPPEKVMGYPAGGYGHSMWIARKVKERTRGGLDIKVYVPGGIFKPREAPQAVKKGAIEMLNTVNAFTSNVVQEAPLEFCLPYLPTSPKLAAKIHLETEFIEIFRKLYAEKMNVHLLTLIRVGTFNYLTRFPIHSLDDLKGKKIRATGAHAKIAALQGASPTFIVGAEQYTALQRGTVDGTLYSPLGGVYQKLFEVVKYVSLPPMFVCPAMSYLVNLDAWRSLPKEYQNILQEEADKLARYSLEVLGPTLDNIAIEEGKKRFGTEFISLSEEEIAKFQKVVRPLWDKWTTTSDSGAELVKIIKDVAGAK